MSSKLQRLQKIIAQAGVSSRRAAEELIVSGRVRVNGKVVQKLGSCADPAVDRVEVEGYGAMEREQLVYIAMYKPQFVVSTAHDPEGRTTVVQLLQQSRSMSPCNFEGNLPRVYPVGRLDFDAEGILLLSNDGNLTQGLLHPRHHVPKIYMVKVRGFPEERALSRLRNGLRLRNDDDTWSRPTAPAEVRVVKKNSTNTWLEMTLFEGRNHQVKRMCEAAGHATIRLIRVDFGGIPLDEHMPPGGWRSLAASEVTHLKNWVAHKKAS
jgi:23S rRNA pseudouridine2605 synthase